VQHQHQQNQQQQQQQQQHMGWEERVWSSGTQLRRRCIALHMQRKPAGRRALRHWPRPLVGVGVYEHVVTGPGRLV
jgi:hypothetical protein